jgi:hypothetical protein
MNLKSLMLCALVGSSLAVTPASAVTVLTLDPSAPNTGAPGGRPLDVGTTDFLTSNSQIAFTSVLDISGAPGSAGTQAAHESGNFQILNFNPTPTSGPAGCGASGACTNVTNTYNLYGTFRIDGTGTWVSPAAFNVSTLTSFNTNIYGSPGCTTSGVPGSPPCVLTSGLVFSQPTTGSALTLADFGINQGTLDFLLASAGLISTPTNTASAIVGGPGGSATTNTDVLLALNPVSGTTGETGFWELPNPFSIDVGSQAGGNTVNTFFTVDGTGTHIRTTNVAGVNQGGGSLNYVAAVPEPVTLALTGLGLLAAAVVSRRRKA